MIKKINILIICICSFISVYAQDVVPYFTSMPDDLMPLLTINRRKDLIDLSNSGKTAQIENSLKGTTIVQTLKDNYICLRSDSSTIEIAMLPMINDSYVICMIHTVCGPVCDSNIRFFTTEWKSLDKKLFLSPVENTWFFKDHANKNDNEFLYLSSLLDMDLIQYHINPDQLTLEQKYNTPLYLNKNGQEKLQPYLKEESKIYIWNKMRFE